MHELQKYSLQSLQTVEKNVNVNYYQRLLTFLIFIDVVLGLGCPSDKIGVLGRGLDLESLTTSLAVIFLHNKRVY